MTYSLFLHELQQYFMINIIEIIGILVNTNKDLFMTLEAFSKILPDVAFTKLR